MDAVDYRDALRDLENELRAPAVHASASVEAQYLALWVTPAGVRTRSEFFDDAQTADDMGQRMSYPYLLVHGAFEDLNAFLTAALELPESTGDEDFLNTLRVLNESEFSSRLSVVLRNTSVTAVHAPGLRKYPGNLPESRRPIWDTVMQSVSYLQAIRGATPEAMWAIAARLYNQRCQRLGVPPFSDEPASHDDFNAEYQEVFRRASSLEYTLRNNLMTDRFITDFGNNAPWRYVDTQYVNSSFVLIGERAWTLNTSGSRLLARLINRDGFKANDHGAGYVLPISKSVLLRVRVPKNSSQAQVQMHVLIPRTKLLPVLGLTKAATIDDVLHKLQPRARTWFAKRRL